MAVPEQTPYIEHTGNGATTSFSLGFQCESKDHLIVLVDEIEPPIATWSLTGGNVVFTTAPAAGKKITLQRNTPFNRNAEYQSFNNSFRPQTVNIDFDRIWWKLQELGVADWLMKLYVDRLHQQQEQKINDLKGYVDDRDDELRAYLMEEIRKQGVALDQLDEYYSYLMQQLAQIAINRGWNASFIADASGQTQQDINDFGGAKWRNKAGGYDLNARTVMESGDIVRSTIAANTNNPNSNMTGWEYLASNKDTNPNNGKPYFRTIFEFMPKNVIADVLGQHVLDHTDYVESAINAIGVGGILWVPLNNGQLNISRSIKITGAHKSIKIVGSSGTASRDSSLSTFKWIGPENGGIMFDILQSWGITFEDISFHGNDKATNIIRIRAEGDGLPVRPSHRHNFVRCGFGSTYNQLVVIGDGGNEDLINVKFDSCQFDYYHNATVACESGILIDAPQGYCFDFTNCLFARGGYPLNFFHLKAGSVSVTSATFDGNVGSVDFYIDPYNGAISPQLTVTHAETQSDWFLKTASGNGIYPTRTVLLQNIRHRADNGQTKPMSIYWDLGGQSQLVHVACAFHGIEIGPNASSVVEVAPQWGRTGGVYPITGYEGNVNVVSGLNGFNITEGNRTAKGGLRFGQNFIVGGAADASGQPVHLPGFKIDGDFWINSKSDIKKSLPSFYRFIDDGIRVAASDSLVYQRYTRSVVDVSGKYTYNLDMPITPQLNAIYEVRWNIRADATLGTYEAGVMHVAIVKKNGVAYVRKADVSLMQEAVPILTTGAAMYNPATSTESGTASGSQTALDNFVLRLKFLGAIGNTATDEDLKVSVRRIGH